MKNFSQEISALEKISLSLKVGKERLFGKLREVPEPTSFCSQTKEESERMLARDFSECKNNEIIRVVTGQAGSVWNSDIVKLGIEYALSKNADLRFIVGPNVQIENGENFLLNLAEKGTIKMYSSPRRELIHFRVYGNRKLYLNKYHEPLTSFDERKGKYYLKDNPFEKFVLQRYIREFEGIISFHSLSPLRNKSEILLLDGNQIVQLRDYAKKHRSFVDDYEREDIENILCSVKN